MNTPFALFLMSFLWQLTISMLSREQLESSVKGTFECARSFTDEANHRMADIGVFVAALSFFVWSNWSVKEALSSALDKIFKHGIPLALCEHPATVQRATLTTVSKVQAEIDKISRFLAFQKKVDISSKVFLVSLPLLPFRVLNTGSIEIARSLSQVSISLSSLGPYFSFKYDYTTASDTSFLGSLCGAMQAAHIWFSLYSYVQTCRKGSKVRKFKASIQEALSSLVVGGAINEYADYLTVKYIENELPMVKGNQKVNAHRWVNEVFYALNRFGVPTYYIGKDRLYVSFREVSKSKIRHVKSHLVEFLQAVLHERAKLERGKPDENQSIKRSEFAYVQAIATPLTKRLNNSKLKKYQSRSKSENPNVSVARSLEKKPTENEHIHFSGNVHYNSNEDSYQLADQRAYPMTVPWRNVPIFFTVSSETVDQCTNLIERGQLNDLIEKAKFIGGNAKAKKSKSGSVGIKSRKFWYQNGRGEIKQSSFVFKHKSSNLRIFGSYDRDKNLVTFDGPAIGH